MTIEKKLLGTSPSGDGPTDVADVFSTHLYTGTGSTKTITNGIDLAGEGGLVWLKMRNDANNHNLFDTERGVTKELNSNAEYVQNTVSGLTSFNSNGFTVGSEYGNNGGTMASWTFRKKEKFFTCLTYSGNSNGSPQTIAHNLGSVPAMIIVKATGLEKDWIVYHKNLASSSPEDKYLILNSTRETRDYTYWYDTAPTDSAFTVGDDYDVNGYNATYVAYLFADNSSEDAEDQMIKCGGYTGTNTNNGPVIDLGWEPQFVMIKSSSGTGNWIMFDTMRGMTVDGTDSFLMANAANNESGFSFINVTPTGFKLITNEGQVNGNSTYIYMAIRGPMMVKPKAATDVFAVDAAGSGALPAWVSGFPVDFALYRNVSSAVGTGAGTRMLGTGELFTNNTANIAASAAVKWDFSNGFYDSNSRSASYYSWMWKRAKGHMDCVAYSGSGNQPTNHKHSLGVVPELILVKVRDKAGENWVVMDTKTAAGFPSSGSVNTLGLNQTNASSETNIWNYTAPTDVHFTTNDNVLVNSSSYNYIAYLFATLAGVSKVGSYTGNGSYQTINCGFSSGSRFILIKRTNAAGDWYYWDSVRGIVAGNDPHLSLNTTAAQVTNDDSIDPANSGFIVNQVSATNINVSSGTYIFYAIAQDNQL